MKTKAILKAQAMNNGNITGLPLNTTDIPQSLLNIENKDRSNLFSWRGQFSPQFIEALLDKYAGPGFELLDPFAGSGTVLYEAGLKCLSATAAEINPAAYRMACTYRLINEDEHQRHIAISHLGDALKKSFPDKLPLFIEQSEAVEDRIKETLIGLETEITNPLSRLLLDSLIIRLDLYQAGLSREKVMATWRRLKTLVSELPFSSKTITVLNCDARTLPLPDSSVDLVITSPPYINVFNYHQQYRASAEALGWNLLQVAKSEIGSNRKHRSNRFLTVIQYCLDLTQTLCKLAAVCKPSARIIFVVGRESRVRNVPFYNGQIVGLLGVQCVGFELSMRQERVFKNKFGELIYEDILHFTNPGTVYDDILSKARQVARRTLETALASAPQDVSADLYDAMSRLSEIQPSPMYCPTAAFNGKPAREERLIAVR
jgi:16S rRNA G966 N2-methylase RsmD